MNLSFRTEILGRPSLFPEKILSAFINKGLHDDLKNTEANKRRFNHEFCREMYTQGGYFIGGDFNTVATQTPKLHTIRATKGDRWFEGRNIHFIINLRSPKYFQFAPVIQCTGVQDISIIILPDEVTVYIDGEVFYYVGGITKNCQVVIGKDQFERLIKNDGFNNFNEFITFFRPGFTGKIIHWTKLKY